MTGIIWVKDMPEYIERAIVKSKELGTVSKSWEKKYGIKNRVGNVTYSVPCNVSFDKVQEFVKKAEKLGYRVVDFVETPDSKDVLYVEAAPGKLPVLNLAAFLAAFVHDCNLDKRAVNSITDEYRTQISQIRNRCD
jgi:hypothetical protein